MFSSLSAPSAELKRKQRRKLARSKQQGKERLEYTPVASLFSSVDANDMLLRKAG
jgi:hypothetical protein